MFDSQKNQNTLLVFAGFTVSFMSIQRRNGWKRLVTFRAHIFLHIVVDFGMNLVCVACKTMFCLKTFLAFRALEWKFCICFWAFFLQFLWFMVFFSRWITFLNRHLNFTRWLSNWLVQLILGMDLKTQPSNSVQIIQVDHIQKQKMESDWVHSLTVLVFVIVLERLLNNHGVNPLKVFILLGIHVLLAPGINVIGIVKPIYLHVQLTHESTAITVSHSFKIAGILTEMTGIIINQFLYFMIVCTKKIT